MSEVHGPVADGREAASPAHLAALVASRICHDLVSPIGAIANGLELIALSGAGDSPEMRLIAESVENANARIRFFRLAYGAASPGQAVPPAEVQATLRALSKGGRIAYDWQPAGEQPRPEVRAAFLLLQCLEAALPMGGRVRVARDEAAWVVAAESPRLRVDEALWSGLRDPGGRAPDKAALVQFALLPEALAGLGRRLELMLEAERIDARF